MQPLISVVMSVFNGENFLCASIESILNQDMRDFEFIIVNDGSNDNTGNIIEKYAANDDRIRYFHRTNAGLSASLNFAISHATGTWIARMDADDISLPSRFRRQISWLEKTGADISGAAVEVFQGHLKRTWHYPVDHELIVLQLLFNSALAHPVVIGRREMFVKHPYRLEAVPAEDYELWTRLVVAGYRFTNCPDVLLRYRSHGEQVSSSKVVRQQFIRNMVAQAFWAASGRSINVKSVVFFSNLDEIRQVAIALNLNGLNGEKKKLMSTIIWKMAMRSKGLGISLYYEISRVVDLSVARKVLLFFNILLTPLGIEKLREKFRFFSPQ